MFRISRFGGSIAILFLAWVFVFGQGNVAAPGGSAESGRQVLDLLANCRVLSPEREGRVIMAPVVLSFREAGVTTLEEALASRQLVVTETSEGGTVNTLHVTNHGETGVFIMGGEILEGAKQNRILRSDALIPPGADSLPVSAFCVEHGRWAARSASFGSGNNAAPLSVRRAAVQDRDQSVVWSEVDSNNSSVDVHSPTSSLSDSYRSEALRKAKARYESRFRDLPARHPNASGVVVILNGRVLAVDLFGDRTLFTRLWGKLLESYLLEAARREGEKESSRTTDAGAFLRKAAGGKVVLASAAGAGKSVALEAGELSGEGLLAGKTLLHLALFPFSGEERHRRDSPLIRDYSPSRN